LQCLIDNGADVLAEDHQQVTTLHFAVGDPSCVSVAIRDGCEVHAFHDLCRTPYHYATLKEETNYKVVDVLKRTPGFKPGAVEILRNTAEDYDNQDRTSFIDRFDQTIQWMDRMLSRNSLHDIYVWWYSKESRLGMALLSQNFIREEHESLERRKTWVVVDNSEDEDYDPSL